MSVLKADEIAVGVKAQRLIVRGVRWPDAESKYGTDYELDLDLQLARELLRLLAAMLPLAEASKPAAEPVPMKPKTGEAS